jgi:redox-sensitive bicupin YhaK (pirin superfamily)
MGRYDRRPAAMSIHPDNDPECVDCASGDVVELIVESRPRTVGHGTVARVLPSPKRRLVGPFIFLDRMGPARLAPGAESGIGPHPHIGLSTLTYVFDGESVHRDSTGAVQTIRPGEVNLMTAGRGVVHSERPDPAWRAKGGSFDGAQIWLALPLSDEDGEPRFEHFARAAMPEVAPAPGVRGRVLAGTAFGATSPVGHPSRPWLVDVALDEGATLDVPIEPVERAVVVMDGSVEIGPHTLTANQLAALRPGAPACIRAATQGHVLLIGGPPLGERLMDWNFVASTRERLDRARDAWIAQTFPKIPGDDQEYVPYPDFLLKRARPTA